MGAGTFQNEDHNLFALRQNLVDQLKNLGVIHTSAVEQAFRTVPRHIFVPDTDTAIAYSNTHIVTKRQDNIAISSCSQPTITAIMLEMLDLQPGQRVLEIGAGTGYAAALIAHLVGEHGQVITIDIDESIVYEARTHLQAAGITNVQVINSDGVHGWEEAAPYDCIILTVGASDIAPAWHNQLRPGGRLVLPLHVTNLQSEITALPDQWLLALKKDKAHLESIAIRPCGFIPLRGNSATEIKGTIVLSPESGLSCITSRDIDIHSAYTALSNPQPSEDTGIHIAFTELPGLRRWLALSEPYYSELYARGPSARESTYPSFLNISDTFRATIGLYKAGTWSLLALEEDTSLSKDPQKPFKLTIKPFGSNHRLTQRLKRQLTAWDKAGHPLVWSAQGTMEDLRVRVYPLETTYKPRTHEILRKRPWTQLVFTPKAQERNRAQAPPAFFNSHSRYKP